VTRHQSSPSPALVAEFERDRVCQALMNRAIGQLRRSPRFHGWSRDELRSDLWEFVLPRLGRYERARGPLRSHAACIIRSAVIDLNRRQRQKRLERARRMLSLHEPDRSGQTPAERLRAGAARSHVNGVIDQTTIRGLLRRMPSKRRKLLAQLARHGANRAQKRSGLTRAAFQIELNELRTRFATGGFDVEAERVSRPDCALSGGGERTYMNGRRSRRR